ncbi:FkbM family methyltransferase [Cryptosporangium sp. NPDC048952]|uniref:FkbM family methyltransferase n=1 Tax=Cryptosporangium sp. NPDC048952 TaxID=3363961 RepID=UPI0037177136
MSSSAVVSSLRANPAVSSIHQSLDFYWGNDVRDAAMDAFHASLVRPGDVVFDIGAHVGDRVASYRRLGARVVALEPQPLCSRALTEIFADDPGVRVVEAACGASAGSVTFYVNTANPTVSTVSKDFVEAAFGANGWRGQVWDTEISVPTVTLDDLIREYGEPSFVKIDVEGYEHAVLSGLSRAVPALSFEFTTIERDVAQQCLDRAVALGFARFNVALGDTMGFDFATWVSAEQVAAHLAGLPHEANSGDVYCRRS